MENIFEILKKRTVVIAEIGCNHNGDMKLAVKLIEAAALAGADVAKFQSFNPDDMITIMAPKAKYQIRATGTNESQYQRLSRLKLNKKQHDELNKICERNGITFASSPFDLKSANLLHNMNISFFKIPSGEITNLPLLKKIGSFKRPIILSTGMATLGEVEEAINSIGEENRENIILMHCTSDYPARWEDANLKAIYTLKDSFKLPVGLSDHTEGIELSLIAVGMGACVIEKHITLDKNMEGGDHRASLEPHEFKALVEKIRAVKTALGNGIKRCMLSEENVRNVARKSIVAIHNINKGEVIKKSHLAIKRPGTGIMPKYIDTLIGSRARNCIAKDQLIKWSQIALKESKSLLKEL